MGSIELALVALAVAMDAVAVSITQGARLRAPRWSDIARVAAVFGVFQGLMPVIGWALGSRFSGAIVELAPWIAFVLLLGVGGHMLYEALHGDDDGPADEPSAPDAPIVAGAPSELSAPIGARPRSSGGAVAVAVSASTAPTLTADERRPVLSLRMLLVLGVATSIDALAVGVTFAVLDVAIVPAVLLLAGTTFVLAGLGVRLGARVGHRLGSRAEIIGGIVLIGIGLKILAEHLFF